MDKARIGSFIGSRQANLSRLGLLTRPGDLYTLYTIGMKNNLSLYNLTVYFLDGL